jgi:hypothetical protein
LIAAAGVMMPALIVAPAFPAGPLLLDPVAGLEPPGMLDPQAEMIAPRTGSDMPTTVPRRMKSRRDSRPAANSSMMWFPTAPWPSRRRSSRR